MTMQRALPIVLLSLLGIFWACGGDDPGGTVTSGDAGNGDASQTYDGSSPNDAAPSDAGLGADAPPAPAGGLRLAVAPSPIYVSRGSTFEVDVAISRGAGFTGEVVVSPASPVSGFTLASPLRLAPGQTGGKLAFSVSATAGVGPLSFVIQGVGPGGSPKAEAVLDVRVLSAGLDSNFGTQGLLEFAVGKSLDQTYAFARQPDGKVIVAGETYSGSHKFMFVARMLQDGSVDATFGELGVARIGVTAPATDIAIQSDGKVLASVSGYLFRLDAGGVLDPTFGEEGHVTVPSGIARLEVLPDGRMLHATVGSVSGGKRYFKVTRLDQSGKPDATFGGTGTITVDAVELDTGTEMELLAGPGGTIRRILLAGTTPSHDVAVVALTAEGAKDETFGSGGVTTLVNALEENTASMSLAGEKVVLSSGAGNSWRFVRLKPDGQPDETFDGDGIAEVQVGGANASSYPKDVRVAGDGSVFVIGTLRPEGSFDPNSRAVVVRLDAGGSAGDAGSPVIFDRPRASFDVLDLAADGAVLIAGSDAPNNNRDVALFKVRSANLSLDPSYAQSGVALLNVMKGSQEFHHVALQPDGKIVGVGWVFTGLRDEILVARFLPNGALDSSFESDGWRSFDDGRNGAATANFVLVQPDGKLVVIGYGFVARLLADGALDSSFGTDGISRDVGEYNFMTSGVLRGDGSIIVGGTLSYAGSSRQDLMVVRMTSSGKKDGAVTHKVTGYDGQGLRVALQSDGKILLAGMLENISTKSDEMGLLRLTEALSPDTDFGTGGLVKSGSGGGAVHPLADGKILAGGRFGDQSNVGRFDGKGVLDKSFGVGGYGPDKKYFPMHTAKDLAVDPAGAITFLGTSGGATATLARIVAGGTLDTSFHTTGFLETIMPDTFGPWFNGVTVAMARAADGKVVISGAMTYRDGWSSAALSRYLP